MKKFTISLFFAILVNLLPLIVTSQEISREDAITAATHFIRFQSTGSEVIDASAFTKNSVQLAWIIHCRPQGFVIVSNSKELPPVLAWSNEGNFGDGDIWEELTPILQHDFATRLQFAGFDEKAVAENKNKWEELLEGRAKVTFKQWPPEGWSPTGGWLFTNWTQSAPYNGLCPVDPQTHQRSVAGCPATAMAQILNFHHTINNTRFSDADDYYHNFGSGNQFWIDNDWESRGFPSWPQLNEYLDTLNAHYTNEVLLTNTDKAAITYACGAAARQVYSPSVSGTYGIDQAYDAFVRFGFSDAVLIYPNDTSLNTHLTQNVMMALPSQLGLVNPEGTAGHNVVVDGYSNDGFYHFNFGWGGSANGWYSMPPTNIPYNLTIIEGIVLDINLSNAPVAIETQETNALPQIKLLSHSRLINIRWNCKTFQNANLKIVDLPGRVILEKQLSVSPEVFSSEIRLPGQVKGLLILCLKLENGISVERKFLVMD